MSIINEQELCLTKLNTYIIGDSTKIKHYFNECTPFVDLTVTSPPYWDAKKYGDIEQVGFGQSYDAYLESLRRTFQGVYNISKTSASLYVNIDTIKRNGKVIRLQDDICRILESIGWIHQDIIIWDKGKTLPWSSKGKMRNIFEYILFFTKSNEYNYNIDTIKSVEKLQEWWLDYPERYSPDGKVPENIWRFPIPTQGSWGNKQDYEEEFRHACPFPPEMMARIVKLSSNVNDVVFDPFAGTGVLLATSELLKRRYLGLDTNEHYRSIYYKVTKPLVAKRWEEIDEFYQLQEHLKTRMKNAIYKLRKLKYPKALLMRLRKDDLFNGENPLLWNFSCILALSFESDPKEESNPKRRNKVIGAMKYFILFTGNDNERAEVQQRINDISSKAPFTKYGLITEVELVSKHEFLNNLNHYYVDNLYVYTLGNTKKFDRKVNDKEICSLTTSPETQSSDSVIPPILSNVCIQEDEYSMIPANKYKKKSLLASLLSENQA
ncbi:DNA-methyltransferase [Paenibacillus lautus]|uniref:DNA-methyltransferase n=1 Tax=Paenibacillus lautus TaxID=1401 RepID=UPI000FDC5143|nr:site-specific DNA-methyltransferase [Paenibacillus lautus]